MKFKWTEPIGAKRAREGSFSDIFRNRSLYIYIAFFMALFIAIWVGVDSDPDSARPPFIESIFYGVLIAFSMSLFVHFILWVFPASIIVDDKGVTYRMGEGYRLDEWADISEARIEHRAGWTALAYTVKGTEQRELGISAEVSAQGLQNFIQSQA